MADDSSPEAGVHILTDSEGRRDSVWTKPPPPMSAEERVKQGVDNVPAHVVEGVKKGKRPDPYGNEHLADIVRGALPTEEILRKAGLPKDKIQAILDRRKDEAKA